MGVGAHFAYSWSAFGSSSRAAQATRSSRSSSCCATGRRWSRARRSSRDCVWSWTRRVSARSARTRRSCRRCSASWRSRRARWTHLGASSSASTSCSRACAPSSTPRARRLRSRATRHAHAPNYFSDSWFTHEPSAEFWTTVQIISHSIVRYTDTPSHSCWSWALTRAATRIASSPWTRKSNSCAHNSPRRRGSCRASASRSSRHPSASRRHLLRYYSCNPNTVYSIGSIKRASLYSYACFNQCCY